MRHLNMCIANRKQIKPQYLWNDNIGAAMDVLFGSKVYRVALNFFFDYSLEYSDLPSLMKLLYVNTHMSEYVFSLQY